MSKLPPIVLIHGLWLNALSWERWVELYQRRGHRVIAVDWPGIGADVASTRADPSALDHIGVVEVVDHYQAIIEALDEKPIIMGHSFGGLVTQLLLDHGLGVAGVAVDSAPIKGVWKLPYSTLKSSFPALKNPANNHRTVMLTPEEFHYAFTNTMSDAEAREVYERYAIPGPGRPLFQAALANLNPRAVTAIDRHNASRAPLLLLTGDEDHISPPSLNRSLEKVQAKTGALTAFKLFPGRPHFIAGAPGWEEVATFALDWALDPQPLAH